MFALEEIASQLETKTILLCAARQQLYESAEAVISAAENLANAKTSAMNSGRIDGKNEEIRKAQYSEICQDELATLRQSEARERMARYNLEQAQSNLDLARYMLRIAELSVK